VKEISIDTVLNTKRLRLRAVSLSDIELVWSASRIEGFNDGMVWDPPNSRDELVAITEKNLKSWHEGSAYAFTVELSETMMPIGRVGIRQEGDPSTWNIGFWIHPEHWGQAFAVEAAQSVVEFGFSKLEARRITTAHATWNAQSKRVIEKLGFGPTGANPCGFMKRGKPVAELEYEIEVRHD
jgi:ribosomal-protein-alanine N-acetyltransferase